MNKIVKKIILISMLFAGFSAFAAFAASKKSIVCTTFPQYDWVMNILGDSKSFEVTLLQDNGTDLHSYSPSFKDIATIAKCDLFIYTGGESDEWVEKVLKNKKNAQMMTVNMLESIGDRAKEEEIVEGMESEEEEHEHEHEHDHAEASGHHHHHDEEEEIEYDEHVWLSLRNAKIITETISSCIQKIDSANRELYKKNTASYVKQLTLLDEEYKKVVSSSAKKTLLFADRFPFLYLTEDYNLKYYAAFVGCSSAVEASFDTVIFLSKKLDELKLKYVLVIDGSDKKIAKTVIANSTLKNQQILQMDSLQSVTRNDINKGKTYLSGMKYNLDVLRNVLK